MANLDVCLEPVFVDLPCEERIARIAQAGYKSVEFWFHDATFDGAGCPTTKPKNAAAIRDACAQYGVSVNNMVVNAPEGSLGGAPAKADDLGKYLDRLNEVIAFSKSINCGKAITCSGNEQPGATPAQMRSSLTKAYSEAAKIAEANDYTLLVEPLNTLVDHPGYFLNSWPLAVEVVKEVNSPRLKLLYDVYHMQIMHGNVIETIQRDLAWIGHFHSAAVPGRAEHFRGELYYPEILRAIDAAGYQGKFGLEYFPKMDDHAVSLQRVRHYLESV